MSQPLRSVPKFSADIRHPGGAGLVMGGKAEYAPRHFMTWRAAIPLARRFFVARHAATQI